MTDRSVDPTRVVLKAPNHPIEARLSSSVAVGLIERLLPSQPLDQGVAAELGRHRVHQAWPWLELCIDAGLVEPDRAPGRLLLLSCQAPSPPSGECPLRGSWRVPHVRIILDPPAAENRPGWVRAIELYRRVTRRVQVLRETAARTTPAGGRCYP